jgi:GTPase-associated protein 1, N-terminal domain type 2
VWVEQAVFTSLMRHGRGGYHLVSRSRKLREEDAQEIARLSPSHGSLLRDPHNRVSVSGFPLSGGRFALSRTCEGPGEYSGRGGRQLYTHILVFDDKALQAVTGQLFAIYHNALALGHMFHQFEPPSILEPLQLPDFHVPRAPDDWLERAATLGFPPIEPLRDRMLAGRAVRFGFSGDRAALAECLIGALPLEAVRKVSFATSLQPSPVRPFLLSLVAEHA